MADQKLRVDIIGDASKLNRSLTSASSRLKSFGSQISGIGKKLSTRLTIPLGVAGGIALKSAANFERLKTQLNVLTGSAEEGSKAFERLVKFSAGTPFQLNELVKANNTLMGFGVSAEDAFKHLQMIGDISAVSGGDLQGISVAFGQVAAAGRLMGQDLLQLINNGVPIIDMLSKSMGVAKSEIKELVSEGAVTFPVLVKAFTEATSEGGKFEGGMAQLSQTISGVTSTVQDNLSIAFSELGKEIFKAFNVKELAKDFINFIKNLVDRFKELDSQTKKIIIVIAGIATVAGPVLIVIGSIASGISALASGISVAIPLLIKFTGAIKTLTVALVANPIGIIATAVALLTAGLIELLHRIEPAVSRLQTFFNLIASLGNPIKFAQLQSKSLADAMKEKSDAAEAATKSQEQLKKIIEEAINPTKKLKTVTDNLVTSLKKVTSIAMGGDFGGAGVTPDNKIKPIDFEINPPDGNKIVDGLKDTMQRLKETTKGVAQEITFDFADMAMGISDALGTAIITGENVFAAIGSVILNTIGTLLQQMGSAAVIASKLSSTFAVPIVGAAAGLVAIGLGAAMKAFAGQIQNVQSFATGGIVSAPTLALVGDNFGAGRGNPEVIAPLDKLKSMIGQQTQTVNVGGEFRVEGQDLVLAIQRAEKNRNRLL